jgi:hypothetical protein
MPADAIATVFFALLCLGFVLFGVKNGKMHIRGVVLDRSDNPAGFWVAAGFWVIISLAILYIGFRNG